LEAILGDGFKLRGPIFEDAVSEEPNAAPFFVGVVDSIRRPGKSLALGVVIVVEERWKGFPVIESEHV